MTPLGAQVLVALREKHVRCRCGRHLRPNNQSGLCCVCRGKSPGVYVSHPPRPPGTVVRRRVRLVSGLPTICSVFIPGEAA